MVTVGSLIIFTRVDHIIVIKLQEVLAFQNTHCSKKYRAKSWNKMIVHDTWLLFYLTVRLKSW